MPSIMSNEPEKDPIFVMNSLSEQSQAGHYFSSESLEDRHSTTSSTESNPSLNVAHRKDHEFIPTRMKTIAASKPAADPTQFTRVTSNPLLISAQKQLMKVEEVKKKKEIIPKRGDDEPDWQSNLSSWKDRRRKQSEEALQRVAEVKALESDGDDINQRQKLSIGKKLSSLMYTSGDDDWSDLGLQRGQSKDEYEEEVPVPEKSQKKKQRQSLPTNLSKIEDKEEVKLELEESTDLIRSLSKNPQGGLDGYGEGVPVLNRKISAPVLPYGSPRAASEEKEPPPVRRKSSELSSSMKSRLEAFTSGKVDEEDKNKRVVESDNTFRQKLQNFRKISEPQPEPEQPPGPKPKLSYKNLIGNNFSESNARTNDNPDHDQEDQDLDDVDQLLDDALEESYRAIEDHNSGPPSSNLGPPTEKPPPPPTEEEHAKNQRNLELTVQDHQDLDKQEQEIIASLELEEREHKKYMDRRTSGALSPNGEIKSNPSPTLRNISPALSSDSKKKSEPQQAGRSSYNQHWLVQEAEQRRISEQQMRHQQQQSPVYENSNYVGGGIQPQVPSVPPPSQYTNHQRPPPPPAPNAASNGLPKQQPSPPNENMYANLGQHPPLPPNYQREIPPGPPTSSTNMRGLPGPQVPPRNTHADGTSPKGGSSDRLLSVSGKKKCSHCGEELGRGAAMIIESLRLFYHLRCFRCVVCHVQLGNGSTGTDVRVRNNKLHCQNCYSNDEGLKFSKV